MTINTTKINRPRLAHGLKMLRSGLYEQTHGAFATRVPGIYNPSKETRASARHCCLGVLTEVAFICDPAVATEIVNSPSGADWRYVFGTLPTVVQNWYGFDRSDPLLFASHLHSKIIGAVDANDDYKFDFAQIADLFERTYLRPEAA